MLNYIIIVKIVFKIYLCSVFSKIMYNALFRRPPIWLGAIQMRNERLS